MSNCKFNYNPQYDKVIEELHKQNPHGWNLIIMKNKDMKYLKDYILENTKFLDDAPFKFSFVTRIWYVLNRLQEIHKCPNCGKDVLRNVETLPNKETRTIERFCCSRPCSILCEGYQKARIENCRKKYGCDFVTQTEYHKQAAKDGCMKKYGVPFYQWTEEWKTTYGVECAKRVSSDEYKKLRKDDLDAMTEQDRKEAAVKRTLSNKKNFYEMYTTNDGVVMITPFEDFLKMDTRKDLFKWKCKQCGEVFDPKIDFNWKSTKSYNMNNVYKSHARCPKCYPFMTLYSHEEVDIKECIEDICKEYNYSVCHQMQINKQIIPPYEIDIYIPEIKLGIEYNGVFWHSEEYYNSSLCNFKCGTEGIYGKSNMCDKIGVSLIHIYEDEWLTRRETLLKYLRKIISNDIKLKKQCFPQVLDRDKFPIPLMSQQYEVIHKTPPIKRMSGTRTKFTIYTSGRITIDKK